MSKVAVLGHGVVGSGTVEVLMENSRVIAERIGEPVEIKYILNLDVPENHPLKDRFITDISTIVGDPEIKVVAEAIGGINPVYGFITQCLKAGKHVVTANKQLVAEKGAELLALAKANGVKFLFEASVGGGIPIIRPLHQCLVANKILSIKGILNGTSNYILTKMRQEGMTFGLALKQAQAQGYAEADPTDDVEGMDTCRKICILGSLVTGSHIYPNQVHIEGISSITLNDIKMLDSYDMTIKLVGSAVMDGEDIEIMVAPRVTRGNEMLHHVNHAFNAVEFIGDHVGPVLLSGYGAGKNPTASAMVSDIVECVQRPNAPSSLSWSDNGSSLKDYKLAEVQMLVRCSGSVGDVEKVIDIHQLLDNSRDIITFISETMVEKELDEKLTALEESGTAILSRYRMARIEG